MAGGWSLRGFIIGISILLSLPCQAAADETKRIVHVTSNGWHSGIVIARPRFHGYLAAQGVVIICAYIGLLFTHLQ